MSHRETPPLFLQDRALGAAIRMRQRVAGLSAADVAARCGFSPREHESYERGRRHVLEALPPTIARALDCRQEELKAAQADLVPQPRAAGLGSGLL